MCHRLSASCGVCSQVNKRSGIHGLEFTRYPLPTTLVSGSMGEHLLNKSTTNISSPEESYAKSCQSRLLRPNKMRDLLKLKTAVFMFKVYNKLLLKNMDKQDIIITWGIKLQFEFVSSIFVLHEVIISNLSNFVLFCCVSFFLFLFWGFLFVCFHVLIIFSQLQA